MDAFMLAEMLGYWVSAIVFSLGFVYLIATYLCRTSFLGRTWYGKAIGIILALLSGIAAEALILPRLIGIYGAYVFYDHRIGGNTIRWKGNKLIYVLIIAMIIWGAIGLIVEVGKNLRL